MSVKADEAEVYDESCYPGSATESEDDIEPTDQTSLTIDDTLTPPDVSCSVCSDILIDPVSLHCGHTFCQLCLAHVWRSNGKVDPGRLSCPVCRLPWKNFPGINITLRSIIEKNHAGLVARRKESNFSTDQALLTEFNAAKEHSWSEERVDGQRHIQQQRFVGRLVIALVMLVLLLLAVLVVLVVVGGAFWVWSGASGEYMRKPVSEWSNDDVVSWIEGLGQWTQPNISQLFMNEAITGAQLLKLDKSALSSFGVLTEFRQQTILDAIDVLRKSDLSVPRNLQEFMAAHRKHTFVIAMLYKMWPRFSFLYIYTFSYNGVLVPLLKHQLVSDEEESASDLTTPEFVPILSFAWSWWSYHPWICSAVTIHCLVSMFWEGQLALSFTLNRQSWKYPHLKSRVRQLVVELLAMMLVVFILSLVWPFTPHFLCDLIFYLVIWQSTFKLLIKPLYRFCNLQVNFRHNVRLQ